MTTGARRKTPLLAPSGMIGSFSTNLSMSAKDCSSPQGADDIRAAPQLHRRPDLAVGIDYVGDRDQTRRPAERGSCTTIRQNESRRSISVMLLFRRLLRVRGPCASAEHSAMTREARAIGLVR